MIKKVLMVAVSLLVFFIAVVSFGSSNTGLFNLPTITEETFDTKVSNWNFLGKVKINLGDVSLLYP